MKRAVEKPRFDIFKFTPPGPVAASYIQSEGPIDLILGPWGSGKTVATVFKIARHSSNLFPVCKDGVIHVRCAALRDTYREMAKTALSSWHEFFPKRGPYTAQEPGAYSGGQDRPVKHILEWNTIRQWPEGPKETLVRLEMEFGAIGNENLDSFFKGYEISMGWLNECDLVDESVPGRLYGRTARFPPRVEIMEWEGDRLGWEKDPDSGIDVIRLPRIIMGDYNPPDPANWTYKRHIEEPEKWPGFTFFHQPSGLSPQAENRIGKSRSQYEEEEQAFGGSKHPDAQRNVHGKYAAKKQGTVVYDQFDMFRHRSDQNLDPVRELPFYMGFDAGGTPACAIGQFMPNGQLRGLREIVSLPDTVTGPERFAAAVMEVLLRDFAGMACAGAWGDPSAWYGADKEHGSLAFMETVAQALQVNIQPTASNDIQSRKEAVEWYLKGNIDANTPRSIWDPRLKYTIGGFASQYHLTKQATEGKTDRLEIAKNHYSHIHDAWQYLCYGYRGPRAVRDEAARMGRPTNVVPMRSVQAKTDFDIWNV
ncbi:hypothetical protein [uncultured Nitratireductor sp.]|uniref:hypothetical protein n=1 Tax=uncultured Nitratireductor sp. TaxID=520953 RepID=UPI0025D09D5B|nr:hypothetical protein [uncultured Nitratireductor sp.]